MTQRQMNLGGRKIWTSLRVTSIVHIGSHALIRVDENYGVGIIQYRLGKVVKLSKTVVTVEWLDRAGSSHYSKFSRGSGREWGFAESCSNSTRVSIMATGHAEGSGVLIGDNEDELLEKTEALCLRVQVQSDAKDDAMRVSSELRSRLNVNAILSNPEILTKASELVALLKEETK